MKKLRKMLGKADSPYIVRLMRLIETQSKETIVHWCCDYCEEFIKPIYLKYLPEDTLMQQGIDVARDWMAKKIKLPEAKETILALHTVAREATDSVIQAAARAVGQAASSIHVPTHALGMAFYGSAAYAYDKLGYNATEEEYDRLAEEFCTHMAESLIKVSIPNEPNPAKIDWRC